MATTWSQSQACRVSLTLSHHIGASVNVVDLPVFDEVAEYIRALLPSEYDDARIRAHRRGVKIWFGEEKAAKEHYEAQLLARRHVDGKQGHAVEIGFHSEYSKREQNEAVVKGLVKVEKKWRKHLGPEAEAGVFFGADNWTRVSEAWIEPDTDDPDFPFELASRSVDYITTIEPLR